MLIEVFAAPVTCPCALIVNAGTLFASPYTPAVTPVFVIAISFALAVIPVPPTTSKVTSPEVPPPVKPAPAVTTVTSPMLSASIVSVPAASL